VVHRLLLIDAEHGSLQWCIATLDKVARSHRRVRRQPVGKRHDEGITTGAKSHSQSRHVDQYAISRFRSADQRRISQGPDRTLIRHRDTELNGPGPLLSDLLDDTCPPADHDLAGYPPPLG
jgi:hypothetical protein